MQQTAATELVMAVTVMTTVIVIATPKMRVYVMQSLRNIELASSCYKLGILSGGMNDTTD